MKKRILLVDDSHVVLDANRIALEEQGYEVSALDNPLLVAHTIRKFQPDLILIDVNMPTLGGDLVAKVVSSSKIERRACIVLYSDLPAKELESRAGACGAAGFVRKSSDRESFLSQVRYWLEASPSTGT